MCERCYTTPVDPDDTEFFQTTIEAVTFRDDGYLLGFQWGDERSEVFCPLLTPPPNLDEPLRLYGIGRDHGGSLRGIVVGAGATARTGMYRTKAHDAEVEARMEAFLSDMASMAVLLSLPEGMLQPDTRQELQVALAQMRDVLSPNDLGNGVRVKVPTRS